MNELFLLIDLSCHCGSTACLGRIKGARHLSDSILSKLSRFPFFSDLIKLMNFFWKVFKKKQKKTWDVFLSLTISDSFFNLQILYQSTHSGDERIWKEALEAHQFLEAVYHAEMGDSDTWNFKKLGVFFSFSSLFKPHHHQSYITLLSELYPFSIRLGVSPLRDRYIYIYSIILIDTNIQRRKADDDKMEIYIDHSSTPISLISLDRASPSPLPFLGFVYSCFQNFWIVHNLDLIFFSSSVFQQLHGFKTYEKKRKMKKKKSYLISFQWSSYLVL